VNDFDTREELWALLQEVPKGPHADRVREALSSSHRIVSEKVEQTPILGGSEEHFLGCFDDIAEPILREWLGRNLEAEKGAVVTRVELLDLWRLEDDGGPDTFGEMVLEDAGFNRLVRRVLSQMFRRARFARGTFSNVRVRRGAEQAIRDLKAWRTQNAERRDQLTEFVVKHKRLPETDDGSGLRGFSEEFSQRDPEGFRGLVDLLEAEP
jgi:hypothetical protein